MIKNLKSLRASKGISQQQLADVILVSQQSVNKYENHHVEPDIETLIRIADYFDVSLDYLVGRTDYKEMVSATNYSGLNQKEKKLIDAFKKLNIKQQQCVENLIDSYK